MLGKHNKEAWSREHVKAPVRWQSAPGHPPTRLAYITDQEAMALKQLDLHNSGIRTEDHFGPKGLPSYNGAGGGAYSRTSGDSDDDDSYFGDLGYTDPGPGSLGGGYTSLGNDFGGGGDMSYGGADLGSLGGDISSLGTGMDSGGFEGGGGNAGSYGSPGSFESGGYNFNGLGGDAGTAGLSNFNGLGGSPGFSASQFGGSDNIGYSNPAQSGAALRSVVNNIDMMARSDPQAAEMMARHLGYKGAGLAGFLGTLGHESMGYNPDVISGKLRGDQGTAWGVAQWRGPRQTQAQDYLSDMGIPQNSLPGQVAAAGNELQTDFPGVNSQLMGATSIPQAVAAMNAFERPAGYTPGGNPANVAGWRDRLARANDVAAGGTMTAWNNQPPAGGYTPSTAGPVTQVAGPWAPPSPNIPRPPTLAEIDAPQRYTQAQFGPPQPPNPALPQAVAPPPALLGGRQQYFMPGGPPIIPAPDFPAPMSNEKAKGDRLDRLENILQAPVFTGSIPSTGPAPANLSGIGAPEGSMAPSWQRSNRATDAIKQQKKLDDWFEKNPPSMYRPAPTVIPPEGGGYASRETLDPNAGVVLAGGEGRDTPLYGSGNKDRLLAEGLTESRTQPKPTKQAADKTAKPKPKPGDKDGKPKPKKKKRYPQYWPGYTQYWAGLPRGLMGRFPQT